LAALHAIAQQPRSMAAYKTSTAPVIDGTLGDECWKQAPKGDNFVNSFTGQPIPETTEAWLAYDDKAIYVAFKCFDSHPEELIGREIKPGAQFNGEDYVQFVIRKRTLFLFGQRARYTNRCIGRRQGSKARMARRVERRSQEDRRRILRGDANPMEDSQLPCRRTAKHVNQLRPKLRPPANPDDVE
jgi:hypothetical protein